MACRRGHSESQSGTPDRRHEDVIRARHDAILRQLTEGHGGYVFKTIGDAFCTAFASAPTALTAVLAIQRRPAAAACLLGAAQALQEATGHPMLPAHRRRHDDGVAIPRASLDQEQCAAAWAEGQTMTLEQAIEYALGQA